MSDHPKSINDKPRKPDPVELGEGSVYRTALKNWHERNAAKDDPERVVDPRKRFRGKR
jgi:hypothetical protein